MTTIEDLKEIDPKLITILNEYNEEGANACIYDLIRNVYYYAYDFGHDEGYNEIIEEMEAENKQLKEDNRLLRQRERLRIDSSGRLTSDYLEKIDNMQLFALISERGYSGQIYRSEISTNDSHIEKIETIRIGE